MSEYNKEFRAILEDGVEYDSTADGTIVSNEREALHGYRRLNRYWLSILISKLTQNKYLQNLKNLVLYYQE